MSQIWKRILLLTVIISVFLLGVAADRVLARPEPILTPIPLTDDLGRPVGNLSRRIISLAPSNTEILFALGLGERVVGVTDYCNYPEEAKLKPKVGAPFPGFSVEVILSMEPDLVLAFGYTLPEIASQLEELGIPVVVLGPEDINDIIADIELVGKITGTEERALELTGGMKERIQAIAARTKDAPRPRVFWEFDATNPTKPWTAGPGSFNDILIDIAGGENIGAAGPSTAFQMSTEEIIAADPEFILLGDFQFGVTVDDVLQRPGWGGITAVESDSVYPILDPNLTDRPGPRIVEGLEQIARIIHPELFE